MLSNCESTTSQYYVMYGAGAVFFIRLRQKSAGSGSTTLPAAYLNNVFLCFLLATGN